MPDLVASTIQEVDRIDREYTAKYKYPSKNLINLIGANEKVVFCYYQLIKTGILSYVLTDLKFIFLNQEGLGLSYKFYNIPLTEITRVALMGTTILLFLDEKKQDKVLIKFNIAGVKDARFLQGLCDQITRAKSNLEVRQVHPAINPTSQSTTAGSASIADQLSKITELYKMGALTEDEYKRAKERILSS